MKSPALKMENAGGISPATAEIRAISLRALLVWHGLDPKPEGLSFRVKTDRHNIFVTGNRWYDNMTGTGGAGAIDLEMHLTGGDFSTACQTLTNEFRSSVVARPGIEFPPGKPNDSDRMPFSQLMTRYAVLDDGNWPIARAYLIETRKIEPAIVDELHAKGSIYANNHHPNPGLVFVHRNSSGTIEGASLRDTRHDSSFRPCLGNKLSAWFSTGNLAEAQTVVAVESPIEALSYHTLFSRRNDSLAIVSCSGSFVPGDLMFRAYERRQNFVVGLNNDAAGERGWQKAWDSTTEWTGFKIASACPRFKDWNADLQASVQAVHLAKSQKPSSHKL